VLDGQRVPYVARPYKTVFLNGDAWRLDIGNLVSLAQAFDLSGSAMKGTLSMLAASSELVKEVTVMGTHIDWVVDVGGHTIRSDGRRQMSGSVEAMILFELTGVHARHHARVEPTFLLIDGVLEYHHLNLQMAGLERLQALAEHAQIAVISSNPEFIRQMSREWAVTTLEHVSPGVVDPRATPIDFEIETTISPAATPLQ